MSIKQLTDILIVMMHTSGLSPYIEDDYYGDCSVSNMISFFEGVISYFKTDRDSYLFFFCNLNYMESPSATIEFFIEHKNEIDKRDI